MKAKPKKCVALAFKQFDRRFTHTEFEPTENTVYSPFDPKLQIDGEDIRFILDTAEADVFKATHFKFLGCWIHYKLDLEFVKKKIRADLNRDMQLLRKSRINGLMKLWIYQHHLLARLSWPFLVQEFPLAFAKSLEVSVNPHLKAWAGLYRTTEVGVLFRSKAHFGLGLTPVSSHFKRMQVVRCQLLEHSVDPKVQALFAAKSSREQEFGHRWAASRLVAQAQAQVDLELKIPSQPDRQGLGRGTFQAHPSKKDRRASVTSMALSFDEEARLQHSAELAQQSAWMHWADCSLPFDFSWNNLINGPGLHVIRFVLNSSVNWVRTPDMLKRCGIIESDRCRLCKSHLGSITHILSACKVALEQKRYTWRHDSVLQAIGSEVSALATRQNGRPSPPGLPPLFESFVRAGQGSRSQAKRHRRSCLLDGATDWRVLVDFAHSSIVFPPEILSTSERPDVVIWSLSRRRLVLMELTCPSEENMEIANLRKAAKYAQLASDCRRAGWTVHLFPVEVGARGFVGKSMLRFLTQVGLMGHDRQHLVRLLSNIAVRCSYSIYLASASSDWDHSRPLLVLGDKHQDSSLPPHSSLPPPSSPPLPLPPLPPLLPPPPPRDVNGQTGDPVRRTRANSVAVSSSSSSVDSQTDLARRTRANSVAVRSSSSSSSSGGDGDFSNTQGVATLHQDLSGSNPRRSARIAERY